MSFVVIGVTVNVFINTNLSDPYIRIQRSYFNGTMDLFLLSPMSIYTPLLGLMTKSILDDYPRLFFTFGFGMLLFGATFNFAAWPLACLFTGAFFAAGFGIGLLSASSFYLLNIKKGTEPVQFVTQQLLATLLAGAYYPVTVLPSRLQWVACLIPHTYAFDALRRLLDPGAQAGRASAASPAGLARHLPGPGRWRRALAAHAAVSAAGVAAYGWGIERARRNGTLTRWQ